MNRPMWSKPKVSQVEIDDCNPGAGDQTAKCTVKVKGGGTTVDPAKFAAQAPCCRTKPGCNKNQPPGTVQS